MASVRLSPFAPLRNLLTTSLTLETVWAWAKDLVLSYNRLANYLNTQPEADAGCVRLWAPATVPAGWLACDGSTVAVADYPVLFERIGYDYGGAGANFDLPTVAVGAVQGIIKAE